MKTSSEKVSMEALKQFCGAYPMNPFHPLAYYDKHLDCIRIQIKDCSFTEVRMNGFFTLWHENHVTQEELVGFTIKGVKHLFVTLGLPKSGPVYVTKFLDAILRLYPEQGIKETIQEIKKRFKGSLQLPVSELPEYEGAASH